MNNKKKRVLADHKKVGRRLIPPFVSAMPDMTDVSYRKSILPEILWIAILIDQLGEVEGTETALTIARAIAPLAPARMMGLCSSYAGIDEGEKVEAMSNLGNTDSLSSLLSPLNAPYPESPLSFLSLPNHSDDKHVHNGIALLERLLPELFDRGSRTAVMALAGAVYIGFCTDKIKVVEGVALAKFPEIEQYPKTELSKQIAAGVPLSPSGGNAWIRRMVSLILMLQKCLINRRT